MEGPPYLRTCPDAAEAGEIAAQGVERARGSVQCTGTAILPSVLSTTTTS